MESSTPSTGANASLGLWNSDIGWLALFPDKLGESFAPQDRSREILILKSLFRTEQGIELLRSIPVESFALTPDYSALKSDEAPNCLKLVSIQLMKRSEEMLARIAIAAMRAVEETSGLQDVDFDTNTLAVEQDLSRVLNFMPLSTINSLRASSVGQFVSIHGVILLVSTLRQ